MTMREYLCQQCEEMLALERGYMELSDEMIADSQNTWVKEMLNNQRVLIWQRTDNLQTLVKLLGGKPHEVEDKTAVDPLLAYHRWKEHTPSQEVIDLHNAYTSASIAQKDIPLYHGIIQLARKLENEEVALTVERFITDQEDYLSTLCAGLPALVDQLMAQRRKAA